MEQKIKGGKREGSGRKPMSNLSKKTTSSIYEEGSKVLKFGNAEKLKTKLQEFIDEFGAEAICVEDVQCNIGDMWDGKVFKSPT